LAQSAGKELPREKPASLSTFLRALGPIRLTDGRLAGVGYAPYPTRIELRLAQAFSSQMSTRPDRGSSDWFRSQALCLLISKRLGPAIASLERAVQRTQDQAEVLSDLSALHGERARSEDRSEDYVTALDLAERAVSLAPGSAEATFNRALALEHLFLDNEARKAWDRYLTLDSSSPWAEEARAYLDRHPAHRSPSGSEALEALDSAVVTALKQGQPQVAVDFQSEWIAHISTSNRSWEKTFGLLRRARIEAAIGRQDEARLDFRQAIATGNVVPTWMRGKLAAAMDIARREVGAGREQAARIASDNDLLAARADFDFRRGNTAAGEYDLDRARALLDRLREISADEPSAPHTTAPLSSRELCGRMPAQTIIVIYAVIEDRLVTWLVRPSGIKVVPQQPTWPEVSKLVERLHPLSGQSLDRTVLEQLARDLGAPWKNALRAGDRIVFVPTRASTPSPSPH
jgi:tetratricopeptide (TPR) repeat protein